MSIHVLCPRCGNVTEWHRPPVSECGACHTAYPAALRPNAEASLRRELAPKPALLLIGQIISAFIGAVFLILLVLAPFDVGSYSINDEPVTGPEFFRRAGFSFGLIGILLVSIAVGLWREREWVRPLMLLYWVVLPLSVLAGTGWQVDDLIVSLVAMAVGVGCAAWYLYARQNVRAYFEARPSRSVPVMPNGQ